MGAYRLETDSGQHCRRLCMTELGGKTGGGQHKIGQSMYTMGYVYCSKCEFFFARDVNPRGNCRCCGQRLRSKPRSASRYKNKLKVWENMREKSRL